MSRVAIVIVSYNVERELEVCLRSLRRYVAPGLAEIVVVDNASSDGTVAMVRRNFPEVSLIANERNEGFGRANNRALRRSDSEFVLILNPDTESSADPVAPFMQAMADDPRMGMASCILREEDGSPQRTTHVLPNYWTLFLHFTGAKSLARFPGVKTIATILKPVLGRQIGSYLASSATIGGTQKVEAISGAFMFCRRKALEEVGYFDEGFFLYSEDIDLSRRVAEAGWGIALLPVSPVKHLGGRSMEAGCGRFSSVRYRGDFRYFKKYHAPGVYALLPLIAGPPLLARAVVWAVAGVLSPARRALRFRDAREALRVAALTLRVGEL